MALVGAGPGGAAAGAPGPWQAGGTATPVRYRAAFLDRRAPAWASLLGVLGALALWEALARTQLVPPVFLPAPTDVLAEGWAMVRSGELAVHLAASIRRIALGLALGAAVGAAAGVAVGFFRLVDAAGTPLIAALYPIPKIAILPLLILWLGIGEASKVAVIALGVFFPMAINTAAGVKHTDPLLLKVAVCFGAGPRNVIRKVVIPSALPMIFAGLRLAAGTSLLLLVSAEMVAADTGVGFLILHSGHLMRTDQLMVGVVTLSLLGVALSSLVRWLERAVIPWQR